jgi:hypothetical protein
VRASINHCVIGVVIAGALLVGCAGKGDVATVHLHALPAPPNGSASETPPPLKVVIMPFEDRRAEKNGLGRRTHLGGGTTQFDVPGGKPGDAVAKALTDYLRQLGWQVTMGAPHAGSPDVTLSGEIQDLTAHAKSRFGSTKMTVRAKLAFRILNAGDRSTARFAVNGARTESVVVFEPEQLARLLNEILRDAFEKLVTEMMVENRTRQPR